MDQAHVLLLLTVGIREHRLGLPAKQDDVGSVALG